MLKKIFTIIATWWIAMVAVVAFDVPQLTGRVTDTVGFFSKSANAKITKRIRSFEENTGAQLVVATLPELVDVSIEEAGIQLMDKWKIGAKSKDDGVIILIVPSQRRFRIEVGYGLEGVLTDGRCGDILRTMSRAFKSKHYPSGVIHAIDEIEELLDDDAESQPQEGASIWVRLLAVPFVILVFFLFVVSGGGAGGGYYGGHGGGGGGGFSGGGGRGGGGGASGGW